MARQRKIIYKFVFVLLALVGGDRLFGIAMNYALAHQKRGDFYELNYKLFNAHAGIVVLGSSRAKHHYNAAMIQDKFNMKCVNCGQDGMSTLYYLMMLKTLLQQPQKPKMIIVDIKPLEFGVWNRTNVLREFYPLGDKVPITKADLNALSPYESVKLLSNAYRFNNQVAEIVRGLFGDKEDTATITGYVPLPGKSYTLQKQTVTDVNLDTTEVNYFKEIIRLCKSNNIKLVVCTSPYYQNFRSAASMDVTAKLCRDNSVQYINYTNDSLMKFPVDLYMDEAHLDSIGANLFTKDFVERVKQ